MTARPISLVLILFILTSGALFATGLAEAIGYEQEGEIDAELVDHAELVGESEAVVETSPADDILPEPVRRLRIDYQTAFFLPVGPSILGDVEIADFLTAVEADRRLLSELRKSIPDSRVEAEIFLARLKYLAERSDPVRLAPKANRVLEQAPIFYDWLETEFESEEEEIYEYYIGGAQGFSRALDEFQNAVLMTAINRLDTAARMLQEAYTEPLE